MNDIKQCVLTGVRDDSGMYPIAQATYNGKAIDVVVITPYGMASIPPLGSLGVMFKIQGRGDTQYAIFNDFENRFKNLSENEVQIGNFDKGTSIKYDKDGNITIDAPEENVIINAAKKTTINSDVIINGGLQVNGESVSTGAMTASNFTSSGAGVSFNTHIHTGDTGGDTGAPK